VFRSLIALAALIPLLAAAAGAEPLDRIPNPRARDGTWVTDMPGRLRPETVARLNATISEFERTSGAEMAVVVIRSLDGLSIDEAAVELFERGASARRARTTDCCFSGPPTIAASASRSAMGSRACSTTARWARSSTPT
jgi:uncharacterized membrane protein YgcG